MQYSQMIKYIINKKAENTTLRFFVYPFLENTHNTPVGGIKIAHI